MGTMRFTLVCALAAASANANEVSELLEQQGANERAEILASVLHQSGKGCGQVTRTFLQGSDSDDAAYWNVSCSNGEAFSIQIPADPSAKSRTMECSMMKMLGIDCFKKLD